MMRSAGHAAASSHLREDVDFSGPQPIVRGIRRGCDGGGGERSMTNKYLLAVILAAAALAMYFSVFAKFGAQ
jgi:hypothetical protein